MVVLSCAAGLSNKAVAARERVTAQTVGKWRRRFVEHGLDGLLDTLRPGVPRTIDAAKVESVVVQTLESQPAGAMHWSTRSMARHSGISASSVGRIRRAFGLRPHRLETFQLSSDPLFVDKLIKRGAHRSVHKPKAAIAALIQARNDDPKPLIATKSADAILHTIARHAPTSSPCIPRLIQRSSDSPHRRPTSSKRLVAALT